MLEKADLSLLGVLANHVKTRLNGDYVFFNRNFHIEPTNICRFSCKFCSYRRSAGDPDSWDYSLEEMLVQVKNQLHKNVTEVHIVGGAYPNRDISSTLKLIESIRAMAPELHIKAYSAVELDYMFQVNNTSVKDGLAMLKKAGLNSLPGGGAEIFNPLIRNIICPEKTDAQRWLEIHETAHNLGIPSNATMLYGHIESAGDRISHMDRLRSLQDKTGGLNCFIPLKYRRKNNPLGTTTSEVNTIDDLRMFAVSRIFMDNIRHLKAYWPMLGKDNSVLALSFGVDDLDGTIDDTTKIYSMAGVKESNISMSSAQMVSLIKQSGYIPAERDSLYNILKGY